MSILITGGSGFFGNLLKLNLLKENKQVISVDILKDTYSDINLSNYSIDILDFEKLEEVFINNKIETVIHCAALLAHSNKNNKQIWNTNVIGTKNICVLSEKYKINKIIFISTNCLWAENMNSPVLENDIPKPVEIYGESKLEAEKVLKEYFKKLSIIIFRVPTIIDSGRLGLLTILFEFINEGKTIWVVGKGSNRYQFIYVLDIISAIKLSFNLRESNIFNLGSDNVKTLNEIYNFVIDKACSKSKLVHINKKVSILILKILHILKLSPLGIYHYKMISEDFIFNTDKVKKILNWKPTLTNEEMLYKAYEYYSIEGKYHINDQNLSIHRKVSKLKILKLLKWFS